MLDSDETRSRLIAKFKTETLKHLNGLRSNLPKLELEPLDEEAVKQVFFLSHTIKGNVAMMLLLDNEFDKLNSYAQKLEAAALALYNHVQLPTRDLLAEFYYNIHMLECKFVEVV